MAEQTAAERYRAILAAKRSAQPTYKKISPSGMEWELRPIKAQSYILSGKLPLHIAEKVAEALDGSASPEEAFAQLSKHEQLDAMRFMQTLVQQIAVNPKIVQNAVAPDEIDEIDEADFAFLLREAMGGDRAESLGNFRAGQGQAPVAGAHRKKRRAASK